MTNAETRMIYWEKRKKSAAMVKIVLTVTHGAVANGQLMARIGKSLWNRRIYGRIIPSGQPLG